MLFFRLLFILVSSIVLISPNGWFAASESASGNTVVKPKIIEEVVSTETEEKKMEDKKTEKNAQKIILEVYKIQGNKILKDMWTSIERVNPDPKVRIEVYTSIQKTLELRKNKLEKSDLSEESKDILTGYIEYMITSIEKKKKSLE